MKKFLKKLFLYLLVLSLFSACETGRKPDSNSTKKLVSASIHADIENLIKDEGEDIDGLDDYEFEPDYIEGVDEKEAKGSTLESKKEPQVNEILTHDKEQHFAGGIKSKGLDVQKIRMGRHDGFMRMVFDIGHAHKEGRADEVGSYHIDYVSSHKDIEITMNGYDAFSTALPTFSSKSIVKQMYQADTIVQGRYKLIIELKKNAKIRVFDMKKPAKLVIDIKSI